ncbi:LOW QUALITY PROTEIN: histone-lysine N-methyltransferase 2C isoform X1 [Canis lupus familiaris]|uniref:LOW QUALITY PROTEIN: histone-lysine N-methyltransferase 2C isoform X1 n=1 Tax=Canis lupus familiaris TaxID=9615 RepID=UPI0018F46AE1|nr:LOW QUALITY PROTEIN: histone-lysine N-methyltransferase 2C isoform X1 [Canis lupus familiaris]
MSSEEDKSAEQPQPPPPPPEEPGAPAPSPAAADKRPRGRPRKDGASPFQRARKKPRSKGKTTVEDEDSMDGLETTETENIVETAEIKEQSAEEDAEAEVDNSKRPIPVLQRSVSEESASSLVSVGVEAKISEQLCAFCYCGEKSSLGQGDLKQFRVTPGFILPWKSQPSNKKDVDDNSNGTCERIQNSAPRKQRGQRKERSPLQNIVSCVSVSTQTASDDQAGKLWDELSLVGLPDAIDVQALFDPTGTCWAHHRCVEWSLGVCQMEEPLLVNVDKAVVSGSTERCAFCKHLGATIKCCEEKCTQIYHYPCAAGAGTFQDFRNFFLLCPEHIDQAPERSKEDANCAVCDSPGDLLDQFFCTTCGQHYHGMCLDIAVTPLKRAGWQCPECKVCQNCKQSGEDSKMLVCDTCDKGYHTFCLQPVMKSVPTNGWKCKNCRICVECGTRSSSQWHHNCLVCDSCYQQQDNLCPFCGKCYHPELQKDMLHCNMCKRWVHLECDKPTDHELDSQFKEEYICMYCKHIAAEMDPLQAGDEVVMAEVTTDYNNEMEVEGPEDHMVFPEQAINKDISDQESTPGIVPDAVHIPTEEQQQNNPPESLDTHGLLISESSQDKMNPEVENQISHEVDSEKMEMSSKVMHIFDDQNENKMEVTENIEVRTHQIIVPHEDLQLEESKMLASIEESRPPKSATESAIVPPDTVVSPCEQSTSLCSKEQLVIERVQEEMEQKTGSESSTAFTDFGMAPAVENCVKDGLCREDKPVKLPSETELSFVSAADISKANVSSSLSSDLPSQDILHTYPSTLSASVGNIMPTTYISVTPKIGMGKPAITKRKFSPGRPRSKQGAWSTHNTVSPPSWSPDISEGREIFKPRQLPGSAIWSIKVGRGSGFPGKRRPRGAGLSGRGGRGRSKLKSGIGAVVLPGVSATDVSSNKDEEENSMHNTVVLFSSSDKFTLHQDMCVVCGSFGQGAEGRLLACSQCGQCYHPYCVSIKITKVVLSKGWRCLECTVCEACGKASDPGRLLLCDDCDISYHTYCLAPPLQTVPKGGWKCKWCVWCRHCGATSAGLRCEWQNNYTQCAPCASLSSCPVCCRNYREDDLILQCRQCDRWMHAVCQNLNTEEEVENVADIGFDCSMCRPYMPTSNVPSSDCCESSLVAQIVTKVKELDPPKTYTQDGVCLTESGMTQLQSLTVTVPRRKRSKPKLKLKIINQNSVAVLQTPPDIQSEHSRDGEMDDSREGELLDCDGKSESSPEREAVDDETKGVEGTDGVKKRKRKPYRPGIGGFMVRQRSRTGQGKTKRSVIRKDSSGSISEQLPNRDDGWSEHLPDTLVDESVSVTENTEKIKKRYRKRKNKLEETFPAYLQEAFFGKDLLDTSRQNKLSLDNLSEDTAHLSYKTNMNTNFLDPSLDPLLSSSSTPAKPGPHGTTDDPLADISEVLNTDDDILGIISDDLAKSVDHSDIGQRSTDDSKTSFFAAVKCPIASSTRPLKKDQLDGILMYTHELDKMVTDGKIFALLYFCPTELGGKDVEDLFTAVLSPTATQPPPPPTPQLLPMHSQDVFSRMPLMNGLIGPSPHLPHNSLPPGSGLGTFSAIAQSPYTDARDKNPAFNPMASDANSAWTSSAPAVEGENDTMSNAQRSALKWEKEEALGEMATVAPVLYTNINFPNLKEEFPDWTTRVKQIAKLWRKASSQERAPYVQKARDNRAALRINKVQMSNDPLKRQQQQDSIDPGSRIDSDLFKDPLKQRESEHEQEWKFRQQMRQKSKQQAKIEATQKLEQVKNEQQQQQQQQQQQFGAQPLLAQSGSDTPSSGMQSPLTPQPGNGNVSPAQSFHKDLFTKQLPSTPTSASSDDVFVKPQAPPPAATPSRVSIQEGLPQSQACQPASPQVFSPGSSHSRPPSPMDPYAKMVGTPRPAPGGHSFSRRNSAAPADSCTPLPSVSRPAQMTDTTANRPSPVRDLCSSSTTNTDPYAKPPDTPRPVMTDQFPKPLGLPRSPVVSEQTAKGPLTAGTNDHFTKPSPRADVFQRQRIPDPYARPLLTPAPLDSGPGPFKTPMQPPPSSQDPYGSVSQPRRLSIDPYERPALTPRPIDNFSHNQSSDPYSQPPLTPHPAMNESFAHPSRAFSQPGTISRPTSQDPYSQPPGTPRPVVDSYSQPSGTSRSNPDPYSQPPGTPRPTTIDPYSQQPPTPRPSAQADLFVTSATNQRHSDPYGHPPGTPRPGISVPYSQPPATPRPRMSEGFPRSSMTRPVLMPNQDPFLQAAQTRGAALSGPLIRPPDACSQTPRPPGPSLSDTFTRVSPSATRDPYDQPPMTPRSQSDSFGTSQVSHDIVDQSRPGSEGSFSAPSNSPMSSQSQQFSNVSHLPGPIPTSGVTDTQNTVNMSQADTEKLRQRQKLREIILQQQQQKKMAGRQEKGSQDPAAVPHPAPLQHWQPESISQAFTRPPPPYPGNIRSPVGPPLGPRYAVFPKDTRGPYPPDVTGMGMRPHGFRFGFPGASHEYPCPSPGPAFSATSSTQIHEGYGSCRHPLRRSALICRSSLYFLQDSSGIHERQDNRKSQETKMQAMIRQRSEPFFPNIGYGRNQTTAFPSLSDTIQSQAASTQPAATRRSFADELSPWPQLPGRVYVGRCVAYIAGGRGAARASEQGATPPAMRWGGDAGGPASHLVATSNWRVGEGVRSQQGVRRLGCHILELAARMLSRFYSGCIHVAGCAACRAPSGVPLPARTGGVLGDGICAPAQSSILSIMCLWSGFSSGTKLPAFPSLSAPFSTVLFTAAAGVAPIASCHCGKTRVSNPRDLAVASGSTPVSTVPYIRTIIPELKKQTLGAQMQGGFGCGNNQLPKTDGGSETKKPRSKRTQRTGEKAAPRSKKRKKDEEEKQAMYSTTDTFTHLKQQLSLLPLMEPIIGVNFAHFLPYGSGQFNSGSRLLGTFGSATLEGVSDYYSQLIYKQNNLSNPPTPPASLPPTPPPMACQKMANGFATTEELAGRAGVLMSHEVTKSLGPKPFQLPFRPQDDLLARAIAQGPKTVDVPASLPTPPHNNQEELRIQDHGGDRDTPDSFVPSSSPESVVGMEVSRYPDLSLVKEEPPEPVPSPIIPILPSSAGKGLESRRNDIKTEPGTLFFTPPFGSSPNGPRSGLISVAITLHPTAAENISSVVAAFSDLLHVRIPNSYEVSNAPDVPSMGLVSSHRVNPGLECRQHLFLRGPPPGPANPPRLASSYRLKQPDGPFPPTSNGFSGYKDPSHGIAESTALRPQWCCHCKVVILGSGVRKSFRDLAFVSKDSRESSNRMEKDIVFCSNNCFVLYASTTQAKNSESKESAPPMMQSPVKEMPSKAFHQYSNNISTLDVHCLPQLQEEVSPPASPPITFPPAFEAAKVEAKPDELKVTVKLKPRLRTVHGGFEDCRPINKKWRGMKWKKWSIHIVIPKGSFKPPCEDEIDEFLKKLGTSLKPDPVPKDYRKCCFCHEEGDGLTDGPARLLNLDLDLWVHLNCALWSTEVYETQAGALINVELALRRGLQMKCVFCHKMGATSGCHRFRCTNIYHFTCAIKAQCMFFKDKTMLCPMHKPKGIHEQELSYFAVFRRVYVQRDEVRQIASIVQRGERDHTFRVGSLIFHTIGQLLPQQMQAFHSPKALFPVGYEASRLYWSTRYANRRCRYLCSIEEKDGRPVFVIRIVEQGHEDLVLSDSSPKGVWDKILEPVACVRKQSEMLQLFPAYLKGEDLFGLTVSAVARIAESLPGVEACENYTFRYGRNPLMELPLAVNPTGCARSEPKMSAHVKRPHTLNSTSTSKSFQSTVTGELNAPYSKQFVHSKSSQYRKMKTEWKSNVYLARSRIQGLGLYAARDIEKHTMVIEYIGTIIRNEVANRKEKLYESQNRGVYMFRMDNDHVIDATLTGGPARYINHSCAPNCVAEVVTFERGHKIIISSNRRIQKGEELCYDYKFDFEDDQHKIPCHCGAVNCRKWMN